MRNLNLGLTPTQFEARKSSLGGSDANIIMSGKEDRILRLWQEKRGEAEPEDLSGILPVVMGQWTEELNRYWYERQTGNLITNEGEQHKHSKHKFMACTLDGLTLINPPHRKSAIFEAKHVNQFSRIDKITQKYIPQLHHSMMVMGLQHAVLSVFIGTLYYEIVEVELDEIYASLLLGCERYFWKCVQTGKAPVDMPAITPPVPQSKWREVDMDGHNEWAAYASDWLDNRDAAGYFKMADKNIKKLMDDDVGRAFGHGIECKRAKNGSLRIKEIG